MDSILNVTLFILVITNFIFVSSTEPEVKSASISLRESLESETTTAPVIAIEGSNVAFTCNFKATNIELIWTRNDEDIIALNELIYTNENRFTSKRNKFKKLTEAILEMKNLVVGDSGVYKCDYHLTDETQWKHAFAFDLMVHYKNYTKSEQPKKC